MGDDLHDEYGLPITAGQYLMRSRNKPLLRRINPPRDVLVAANSNEPAEEKIAAEKS